MKKIYQYSILLIIIVFSIITGVFSNLSLLGPQLPGEINTSNKGFWILFLILIFSIPGIAILHKIVKKYQEQKKYFQKWQEAFLSK